MGRCAGAPCAPMERADHDDTSAPGAPSAGAAKRTRGSSQRGRDSLCAPPNSFLVLPESRA
eukprot:772780-Prymnesium_polylepis.1